MSLSRFFESMTRYLDGGALADVEAALGPLPSPAPRYAFYQDLMAANARRVIEHVYPATKAYVGEAFASLARAHTSASRTDHWNLNAPAAGFSERLAKEGHALASEVADLEWAEYEAAVHPGRVEPGRVNPSAVVRQYTHAIADYVRAVKRGDTQAVLQSAPVTVFVYRDPRSHRVRTHRPTRVELIAFGVTAGELSVEAASAAGVSASDLDAARLRLAKAGVIGAAP